MAVHRPWLVGLTLLVTAAAAARGDPPSPASPPVVDGMPQEALPTLTARATREVDARQYDAARASLTQALTIAPADPNNLYALARLDAQTGRPGEAVDALRRSAEAGFTDFPRLTADPDLLPLHDRTDYAAFLADRPAYQRRAAERALATFRALFGAGYQYELDEADKFVFAVYTNQAALDGLKRGLIAQAHSQWAQLFPHHPEGYTYVVYASPADYARLRPSPRVLGYYSPSTHMLVTSDLGWVTTHEFTHALHAGDLEGTGQTHPLWITEGLAVLFERSTFKGDVLTPQPNIRLAEVLGWKRAGLLIRLDQLLRLPPATFKAHASLCYAESGALMAFLHDQGLLRKFYDTYKADCDLDPTGRTALEATTGHPLGMTERDWWQWLSTQRPVPRP
jgi:hypothetical protein